MKAKSLTLVRLVATPWTAAHQAPPSMGFSRQEYWSGVPLPSPNSSIVITYYFSYLFNLKNTVKTMAMNIYSDHNKLWKILKEVGIPDHLICLLRNLYTGHTNTSNAEGKNYYSSISEPR